MPFELQIALRYLLAKRRQVFISVISLVSTLGVTVGVMALVIALAIMTGLQQELRDRILGAMAHVNVWKTGGIADYRAEVAAAQAGARRGRPRRRRSTARRSSRPIAATCSSRSRGSIPTLEREVTEIAGAMTGGSLEALDASEPGRAAGHRHRPRSRRRDRARSSATRSRCSRRRARLTPMGMAPRQRRFSVVGTFRLGLARVRLGVRLRLARDGRTHDRAPSPVDHLELRVADIYEAPQIADDDHRDARVRVPDAGLVRHEPVALFGALSREDRHGHRHRPHRRRRRAQHRRLAHPAGHGEDARHRHPQDDGRVGAQRDADLPDSGHGHRHDRHDRRRRRSAPASRTCSIAIA